MVGIATKDKDREFPIKSHSDNWITELHKYALGNGVVYFSVLLNVEAFRNICSSVDFNE